MVAPAGRQGRGAVGVEATTKGQGLKAEILRRVTLIDPANEGVYAWDIEREFPTRRVRTSLNRLVEMGLLREEAKGKGVVVCVRYFRTGKPLGPDQKLEVFITVGAEA